MSPKRLEDRDLRSLDRPGLRNIFGPLDPSEKPASSPPRRWYYSRGFNDTPTPKDVLGYLLVLLMFPMLLALILVGLWLAVPQLVAWLLVLGFIVVYTVGIVVINRRH